MTTARDIISEAMKDAGILGLGQTLNDEDVNSAFIRLNMMISQWAVKRWTIYHLLDLGIVSTGAEFYTVGPGGNFNVPVRPDKVLGGYARIVNTAGAPVDYPLSILESMQDYSRIAQKRLGTFPSDLFFDPIYPLGKLFVWPIPSASIYEIHILIKDRLSEFPSLNTQFNLPPEYLAAMHYNLASRSRTAYTLPPNPSIDAQASEALEVLRAANAAIPRLRMPKNLQSNGRYNIYSDRSN